MKTGLAAIVFLAGVVLTARAEVGTVSISTANTYSFMAAAGNLIGGLSPSAVVNGSAGAEGTGTFVKLTDGAIIANKPNTYTVGNNAVITYTLGEAEDGYDITGVNLYSGWGDSGRENITVTSLAYSTPADPTTFVAIPGTAVNYSGGTSIAVARYTAAGGPIAEGVYALRINFGPQENNYVGYREIECIGAASAPLVAPPEIVTLPATNVTASSAWINGSLTATGTAATAVIAYWGTSDGDTNATAWANATTWAAPQVPGDFTHPVSGLSADAVYYCRFAASNEVGTAWSESTLAFITGAVTLEPVSDGDESTLLPGVIRAVRPAATLGAPLTVFYEQTGGSAVSGIDFVPLSGSVDISAESLSADVAVTPINNWAVQADTTVELTLQPGGYLVGSPNSATLTITNRPMPTGSGTVHYVSPYGSDEPPYLTWATAARNPASAVGVAAAGEQVLVLSGLYTLSGEIPVTNAITIASVDGAATTILDGGGVSRIFNMTAAGVIDGFTITNGVTTTGGGGVKMTAGTVRNCVLIKNSAGTTAAAGGGGGGVWMSGGLVHDCDIIANTGRAGNDDGGGGARLSGGTISNCYVSANQAVSSGACGGGIALMKNTALAVDCTVVGNTAYYAGGGVWAYPGRVYRCVMTGNRVTNSSNGGGGGGLRDGGTLDACVVTNNTGHGVYYRNGTVRNSLVARNSSAGVIPSVSGGQINNCTLADNGGVGVQLDASGTTIRNTILHGNSAIYGGGNLASTLWYNNLTPTAIPGGAVLSGNIVGDPLFVSSSTGDYRVQAASPAIDAGLDLASLGVVEDLAGTPRPTRNGYDIGSYEESQAPAVMNLAAVATSSEAVLGGKLLYDGQIPTTAILYWGTADGGDDAVAWQHAVVLGPKDVGAIYVTTVGVASATTYYFRNAASNDYDQVWANDSQRFVSFSGTAQDRVWNGAGADALASNGANWKGGTAPQAGDGVVLDTASSKNMTWDAAAPSALGRWIQGAGYTGTVTFETLYGDTGFTNLAITGDCLLLGGTWTHKGNTSAQVNRLRVSVGGDLSLDGGSINVTGKGYFRYSGPGAAAFENQGAAHGGIAYLDETHGALNLKTYGSIDAPVQLGSGGGDGSSYGGGAVHLTVAGETTVGLQSMIVSRGSDVSRGSGSGGSILLETGSLAGSGTISVNGGGTRYGGGGGRAAVILTGSSADFTGWAGTISAHGLGRSGAGTVYLRTAAGYDTLVIDNNNLNAWAGGTTLMTTDPAVDLNAFDEIVIRKRGILGIASTTTLDLSLPNVTLAGAGYSVVDIMADDSLVYPANWVISNVTVYAEGVSKPLGDLTVAATGILSHRPNLKVDEYKMDLVIAGDLTVRTGGSITTMGHGFYSYSGPGYSVNEEQGGAHGGVGGWNNNNTGTKPANTRTYGSILNPTLLGSGGQYAAGGAILLNVSGTTTVENGAVVTAQGIQAGNRAGGSGGSVNLRTGSLVGSGAINAKGGGNYCGAGGRVAVTLTAGDFTGWTGNISAYGFGTQGGAGTVYLADADTPANAGQVVVDNNNQTPWSAAIFTPIPASASSTENLRHTQWTARNKASLKLVADAVLKTLDMQSASYLDLAGQRLAVDSARINGQNIPPGEYTAAETDPAFVSDTVRGGSLFVRGRATHLIVR